jgi:hypothetical protein
MFNSIGRSSNFAQAGKSAADETVRAFAASRRNSPKYGELAQKAANIRSKEKIATMKAEQEVAMAGIRAKSNVTTSRIKTDAKMNLDKSKRKAGALAAAGKLFNTGASYLGEKRTKREVGSESGYYDTQIQKAKQEAAELKGQAEGVDLTGGFKPMSTPDFTSGGSSSSTSSSSTSSLPSAQSGGDTAMRLMTDLTADGYTSTQAAAIVGNAQYESANFTAHEEFAPNSYGTKGAGFFQWTNAGGSNRRDQFESFASSKGLKPTSYEANTGYMMHELKGGSGNHWTGGMNDNSFRQIGDLNTAVTSFQNNYLRPAAATANTAQRMSNAQSIYDRWMSQNK